jgi:hypothetical protein
LENYFIPEEHDGFAATTEFDTNHKALFNLLPPISCG